MKKIDETVQGLLLKDAARKAGSTTNEQGKTITWGDGYIITLLLVGGSLATDIKKYTVRPDLEDSIKVKLADVVWGSLITLSLEDGKVVSVTVDNDTVTLD